MDEKLLERLRAGDARGYRELRARLYERVLGLCRRMLADSQWAEETAEDILMDFALEHAAKVRTPAAVGRYVRMMTVRRCVRLRDLHQRHESYEERPSPGSAADFEEEMVTRLDQPQQLLRLEQCRRLLNRRARRVLRLRFFGSLTHAVIGQRIGMTKQGVGRIIANSLETLRQCLETTA